MKPFNLSQHLGRSGINVMEFGHGVGQGSPAVDTAAWQAAFAALAAGGVRQLVVPPAPYLINQTITPPPGLEGIEVVGLGGYDGPRGPINNNLKTFLKWVGGADPSAAVIKCDMATGWLWSGVSINCDYKAGYGLQLLTSVANAGSVKNIIERCSITYAKRDGIMVGTEGAAPAPGLRQFFGNRFIDLTMIGCARSGIHINEPNADQQVFDAVMVYLDDAPVPQDCLNAFWFDSGGQYSELRNCESGGMKVVAGVPGSGFAILNKQAGTSNGGAHGLQVTNFWQEGDGGLYYGVTSTEDSKAFNFTHCASYTNNPANLSVYIDKGTGAQIPYTFTGCTFLSDVKIASATFDKGSLTMAGCSFGAGKGVRDANDVLTQDGCATIAVASNTAVFPRFASAVSVPLNQNINAFYTEGVNQKGNRISIVATQDAVGGKTIAWAGSTNFSAKPAIPQPNPAASAVSVFTFISDGNIYYLAGAQIT